MSASWFQRKTRLGSLLKSRGDEDADALALDQILHGQSVIGKTCWYPPTGSCSAACPLTSRLTAKTTEIDAVRFGDNDLSVEGTLEYGQYGVVGADY